MTTRYVGTAKPIPRAATAPKRAKRQPPRGIPRPFFRKDMKPPAATNVRYALQA
jgi:hypothetical protein